MFQYTAALPASLALDLVRRSKDVVADHSVPLIVTMEPLWKYQS